MERLFRIARELRDLDVRSSRLSWAKYTTGYDFGVMEVQKAIQDRLKDKASWTLIGELLERDLDPMDRRRVEIMERLYRPYHLSSRLNELSLAMRDMVNRLSSVLNSHRCRVDGRELTSPEISRILLSEPDREIRKKAFLSRTGVNAPLVDAGFIELLDMRKEFAAEYGAEDFVAYSLEQQELESSIFDSWRDDIRSVLPEMKRIRAEFGERMIGDPRVMPWDEAYISGRIAPELDRQVNMTDFLRPVAGLFGRFGIDITEMNITYDIFPRKNKSEWGYNFPVESGVDSRILANVRDRFSQFRVLLHETGHAVHSFLLDPEEVILNMGISGIVSEGIANLFGSFRDREIFYSGFFEGSGETPGNFRRLELWNRTLKLGSVARILFDQSLYRNRIGSIDDIHRLIWTNRSEILGEEPYADQPLWAQTIHHTTHPIYLHNYLMGDLLCDMLQQVFQQRESVESPEEKPEEFGRFVREEVIEVSGRYPLSVLFRRISGEEISLNCLVDGFRDLAAAEDL